MKKVLVLLAFLSVSLFATTYAVDRSHSSVEFKVRHMLVSNTKGIFRDFDGTFDYDDKERKLTALSGDIRVNSIDTDDQKRDDHLKKSEFFDSQKFKLITFKMVGQEGGSITGDLTIKGVTKRVTLDYEFGGEVTDPWGKKRAAFSLEGKINRKEFGLSFNQVLDTGGAVVGDIVKLYIEIEGVAKK
jgi:polyisoprenoid-binding protein YceI